MLCWHGLPALPESSSRLLPLHLSNHFRGFWATKGMLGLLLPTSLPPSFFHPAAYAKPKQKGKCIIKKIKKLAAFFQLLSACTKRKLPHGKRRQSTAGGREGEEQRRAAMKLKELQSTHTHTHTHKLSPIYTDRERERERQQRIWRFLGKR